MFLVGLTGGIAMGKSTVADIFRDRYGVPVIDSDEVARKVVQPGRIALKRIQNVFGNEVINSDGSLNRELLGKIVFGNPDKLSQLNKITHPEIYKEIKWSLVWYFLRGYQFVIIESPLLFETATWSKYVHKTIVVTCEEDLQLERLMDRNNLMESEAKNRIGSQMPISEKCARADFVVENSGNLADTQRQVEHVYRTISDSRKHWRIRFYFGIISLLTSGVLGAIFWYIRKWAHAKRLKY